MVTSRVFSIYGSDNNAAIMANCDYYAVSDLFEILPELKKAHAARFTSGMAE
jgi:electron transfer flavoprotein alpha subunit